MSDTELWELCLGWASSVKSTRDAEAGDIATFMWLSCKRALERYDPSYGTSLRTWLYGAARGAYLHAQRDLGDGPNAAWNRGERNYHMPLSSVPELEAPPEPALELAEWEASFQDWPEQDRQFLSLVAQGYPYATIQTMLGWPQGRAAHRMKMIRRRIACEGLHLHFSCSLPSDWHTQYRLSR